MELKQIRQLAEKYWQADTTVSEEDRLKKQMTSSDDSSNDQQEVEYFKTLERFSSMKLDDGFDERFFAKIESNKPTIPLYRRSWTQIAASVIIAVGIAGGMGFHTYKERQLARQQEAREAFEIAKSALFLVSEKMNKGSQYTVDGLSKFEEAHQKIKTQNFNN